MIDLAALSEPVTEAEQGKPKQIFLEDIVEDENQPRFEFPHDEMEKMANSIRDRGVKSPISVKAHPKQAGKWIINHGARRFRGSIMAGKSTIPAYIDEDHTDYDQVMENKERLDHSPLELALFIKRKIDQGEKKGDIARKLNETNSYVSMYLALIDMPDCLQKAYGRNTKSAKTLYELRKLYEEFPDDVRVFINKSLNNDIEITRGRVSNLGKQLKEPKTIEPKALEQDQEPEVKKLAEETNFKEPQENKKDDPNIIKKPLVAVMYEERLACLILDKKPSSLGFAWIRFEDGDEKMVDCGALTFEYIKDLKND